MKYCPFWSNKKEKVRCFKECAFYSLNKDEECPFKLYDLSNPTFLDSLIEIDMDERKEELAW
ncbi:hypothetical protein KQI89_13865 [Clostridium sp. MSJ-4]|uniref:Uncharacterized protein n=1 Tax=Clostridium simiarum TaxID=2841506 RepID=A0ABS6F4V6_9CLOT|nr:MULTISPECIES: hypothetical protein [Clostridium]MBU5592835.1 hypothetical protein [Clostridium simiarum]